MLSPLNIFTLSSFSQGIPFFRNYSAEDYHANKLNYDAEADNLRNIFIANFEGLMYYDHAEWHILHTPGITRVTVVVRTSDNTIWVGGYNYFGKVVRKANGEIELKRVGKPDLFNGEVNDIFERNGKVRFLVNNGFIYQVEGENVKVWKSVDKNTLRIGVLDVVDIDAVEKGEENVVKDDVVMEEPLGYGLKAIIRKNVGITILNEKNEELYTITDANGICSNDIVYMSYDGLNQLWAATAKGVFALQIPSVYSRFTIHEGLLGTVLAISEMGGKIYAGTDEGLYRQEERRFVKVAQVPHACWELKKSSNGLLAATEDGIYRLHPDGKVQRLTIVGSMSLLEDGSQIYSGEADGVYLIQPDGKRRKVCNMDNAQKIIKDNKGTIWAQSLYGKIWYKKINTDIFQPYKSGKKSETVQTVVLADGEAIVVSAEDTKPFHYPLLSVADANGITWLTDNEGKRLYRWKNGKRLTDLDQILYPIHEIPIRTIYTRQDEIWLGNDNGLTIINTKAKEPLLAIKPQLFIRSVILNGDSVLWGGFGDMPEELHKLNYSDNNLSFTFSLNNTSNVGTTLYRYQLDKGQWSAWTAETHAKFNNIPDGNHTFRVQAHDAMNRQSDIVSIKFHIVPPFYKRWYMYLIYFIILSALVYCMVRLRIRKLENDKIRLEQIIQERTNQVVKLEKMATVGKLTQGLIDRILNPLNYINNFSKLSEGLVKDIKANIEDDKPNMDEENYEDTMDVLEMLGGNLQKVGEHGQNTTRTLKAMEEMLKDRTGGVVNTEVTSIFKQDKEMLEKYYAKEIAEYNIVVDFQIPAQDLYIQANPEQLSKSFMSFFVNSIYALIKKAQRTSYTPTLSVKVDTDGKTVNIAIHDNGIGIEDTIINKIFDPFFTTKPTGEASGVGLYLSNEIIQNYGGDISVKSTKDEFCEFTITLPAITQ
jgi:signal transduction histidine kinase